MLPHLVEAGILIAPECGMIYEVQGTCGIFYLGFFAREKESSN
jgi:hypothetical protein